MKRGLSSRKEAGATARTAKDCAYVAVFVALVMAAQLVLSSVPGVEVVTVLFVTFAFTFGVTKGVFAATAFSLLRQILFGFYPKVLVLYLVYYNLLCLTFGLLGKKIKDPQKGLLWIVLAACVGTVCFTLLDNVLTPIWYGYTPKAAWLYFKYSLPVMIPQTVCTAITTVTLFLPIRQIFVKLK